MSASPSAPSHGTDCRVVIVGGGQAGAETAAALRQEGHAGSVTVVSDEPVLPYCRPPLSKAYLLGKEGCEDLLIRSAASYRDHNIEVRTAVRAEQINLESKTVVLGDGSDLPYDALVLATGARPRQLVNAKLANATNVMSLRSMSDADALRPRLAPGAHVVLIGGGYIGLEIGSVARKLGATVTVLEAQQRVLARVASPELSALVNRVHCEEGIDIRTSVRIADYVIDAGGSVVEVVLEDGDRIRADVILVGIGVVPNTELAAQAGLHVDDGIVVDEYLRTSVPDVYAIGDVARYPAEDGSNRRTESMPNAVGQAACVGASISGRRTPYHSVPWFWSDQFDLKMQMVGIAGDYNQTVVRGDIENGRTGAIFYLRDNVLRAADVVSDPKTFAVARRLVTAGTAFTNPHDLADPSLALRSFAVAQAAPSNVAS